MKRIPFSKDELIAKGEYPASRYAPPQPILSTPVEPKEHFIATVVEKRKPLWLPRTTDYMTFVPKMIPDNTARALIMDAQPLLDEEKGGKDMFGIEWVYVPVANGSMVKPGEPFLEDANDWVEKLVWPNIEEWDWAGSAEANKDYLAKDRAINVWIMNGFYERLISFMDFEGAAIALIDEEQKPAVHALFAKLCDLYEKMVDKFVEYYGMNQLLFHDDWGSQRAPFFSLEVCREMLVPYIGRLAEYCHSKGCSFELHSCGSNGILVPAMIEAKVDIWTPMANINDVPALFEQYGDKIMFGYTMPALAADATEEEKKAAAKEYVDKFCKEDKWIMGNAADHKVKEYIYEYSREKLN
ncbi:MAG: methyltransferase [Anaerofustis stercorihominis]|nr:methyltransferase [Anaerofustis stercorihominis]